MPYEDVSVTANVLGVVRLSKCTLCKSLVDPGDQDDHRIWHDEHAEEHDRIMEQAKRYVDPPRIG